jgi:hypothetical protein
MTQAVSRAPQQSFIFFSACCLLHAGLLLGLLIGPEDGGDVSPKRLFTFTGLNGAVSWKIERFIVYFCLFTS